MSVQSLVLRCASCGYTFGIIAYPPQEVSLPCPNCKNPVKVSLPPPTPEMAKFSWEYAKHPPPATGVHFLPKAVSHLLPGVAAISAAMILISGVFLFWFIFSSGTGNVTITGEVYATQAGKHHLLSGVRVELAERSLITFTDKNGVFEFQDIPIGEYTLILTLHNYSTSEYHIVVFPVVSETFHLGMEPGSGYNITTAGSFRSLYELSVTFYSSFGELMVVSSFLMISSYFILKRKHISFILVSFILGTISIIFIARELEFAWYLTIAGAGFSFAGGVLTWFGRDEFTTPTEWTIDHES